MCVRLRLHLLHTNRGIEQDHHAAYKDLTAAADGGSDGFALYNLGIMYLRGLYVTRDPLQALQYFKRALERGVGAAANAIGVLAAHGEAMPTDYTAAARWFEKGANMSDPDSIYNLGSLYIHGVCAAGFSMCCAVCCCSLLLRFAGLPSFRLLGLRAGAPLPALFRRAAGCSQACVVQLLESWVGVVVHLLSHCTFVVCPAAVPAVDAFGDCRKRCQA